ncbi:MAG: hypothetical protein ACYDBX_03810 [Patescibacteria group bacterium]
MDINIEIVIPGTAIVKKNTAKTSLYYKDKNGMRIPRNNPVHYYTSEYKDWAIIAIQACAVFKTKNSKIQFPITEKLNVKCLFYLKDNRAVDLSNLFQGVHDVLAGNAGAVSVHPNIYQIIYDDSSRFIGSVDGSRILLDMVNPRTVIHLTNYKM